MRLLRLALQNFRNYIRLDETLPDGILILVGRNAQGKTSLLEAVYYLATLSSFQARHDREVVNFDAQRGSLLTVGRIVAEFQREGEAHPRTMEVRLILENNGQGARLRREVLIDGVKKKLTEAVGVFNAVLFLPQMTELVTGAPETRRRYLDSVIAQVDSTYAQAVSEYAQTLTRRNALLKMLNEQGGYQAQLAYWDEMLARWGAVVMRRRAQALAEWERQARKTHWQLTANAENLRLQYRPAYDPYEGQQLLRHESGPMLAQMSAETLASAFVEALQRRRAEEIARGVTTIGPHRDDFRFFDGQRDLGLYGSRGQIRTALLSLKAAEMAWIERKTRRKPVLLLDEILAELDQRRRADLQALLTQGEQVILTTTDIALFDPVFVARGRVWHLHEGRIVPPSEDEA